MKICARLEWLQHYYNLLKERNLVMLENVSSQTCASCGSHIFSYESDGVLVFECSYCGLPVEEPEIKIAKMVDYKYE